MSAPTILRTENVVRHFGGVQANRGVTISVAEGEIRGLIGPNGAGKSTLCNLLSGLYPPTSGQVWFDGQRVDGASPRKLSKQGLLRTYQVPRLFDNMTVAQNLKFAYGANAFWRGRRSAAADRRADELLELTGLAPKRSILAAGLSGGQKALLQIAIGFMVPELRCFILDEPTAGINPVIRESIMDLIRTSNREQGITFLIVSHEMYLIRALCHSVSVLAEGQVLTEGTMDEVTSDKRVIDAYLGRPREAS